MRRVLPATRRATGATQQKMRHAVGDQYSVRAIRFDACSLHTTQRSGSAPWRSIRTSLPSRHTAPGTTASRLAFGGA